jgi:phage gpG-like protein
MKISIKTDAGEQVVFFGEFQKNTIPALINAINAYAIKLRDYIATSKLSGQVLRVRTGTLRSGIVPKLARLVGTKIEAGIATNVIYAQIHEYGGTTHPIVTAKMKKFAWYKFIESNNPMWKAIALTKKSKLTVPIPARPYILPSIRETENDLIEGIKKSLNKIAEEGK